MLNTATKAGRKRRIADLQAKLEARSGKEYTVNRIAIEAEIRRLEALDTDRS